MEPIASIEWNGIVARLHGEVDWTNADVVLDEIVDHGPCVLDLEDVMSLDLAGVDMLLELDREHDCTVVNTSPPVNRLLDNLGVSFLIGGPAQRHHAVSAAH